MTLIPSLIFTELQVVSIEHLQRVWYASMERFPSGYLVPCPFFGLVYASIVDISFPELVVSFIDFSPCTLLGNILNLLLTTFQSNLNYMF